MTTLGVVICMAVGIGAVMIPFLFFMSGLLLGRQRNTPTS